MGRRNLSDPSACLNANLRRANRLVAQWYAQTVGNIGLEPTQFTLLATLEGMGRCTLGDLAAQVGIEQSTATRNIALLKEGGLVTVTPGITDARVREISLTAAGRKSLRTALPAWRAAQAKAVESLGADRAERLLAALEEIETVLHRG